MWVVTRVFFPTHKFFPGFEEIIKRETTLCGVI